MSKKHILVVCQYFYPEPFRVNDMCLEWIKRGYKVTVLTGIPNYPEGRFYKGYGWFKKRRENFNGIEVIRIPLIPRGKTAVGLMMNYASFVVSGWFWRVFTDIRPDYVFTFQLSPVTMALIGDGLARKRKIPHYMYVQDLWPDSFEAITGIHCGLIIYPLRRMVNRLYRRCRNIFATSPSFVEEIGRHVPGEEEKVLYLPQYAEEWYVPVERTKVDGIPDDDRFKIIFTGNIGEAQGLEVLPKAAQRLQERGITDVCFVIVGNGRNRKAFTEDVCARGVESYFVMVDRRPSEEIPPCLRACDAAFISFKKDEMLAKTIPAKLQSYMACGMPILAGAEGETARVVNEAACGFCCAIGDDEALADAIVQMKAMDLSTYAAASLAYSRQHFDKAQIMDWLDRFFE